MYLILVLDLLYVPLTMVHSILINSRTKSVFIIPSPLLKSLSKTVLMPDGRTFSSRRTVHFEPIPFTLGWSSSVVPVWTILNHRFTPDHFKNWMPKRWRRDLKSLIFGLKVNIKSTVWIDRLLNTCLSNLVDFFIIT